MSFYLNLLLVFLLPVQLGKHFWPDFAFVQGLPIDYLSPTLYLTDVLLLGVLLLELPFLVKRLKRPRVFLYTGLLGLLTLINLLVADRLPVSLLGWLRIWSLVGWGSLLTKYSKRQKQLLVTSLALSLSYVLVLALWQIFKQGSVGGLWYWLGERKLDVNSFQTAAVNWGGHLFFRPYSTFSHPNSLAGYLLMTLLILQLPTRLPAILKKILGGSALLLAGLTFSRSALSFGLPLLVGSKRLGLQKNLVYFVVAASFLILLFLPPRFDQSLNRRLTLQSQALALWQNHPWFGVGVGNFVPAAAQLAPALQLTAWLQPVHNIFWLILVETGIVGLILTLYLLKKLISLIPPIWLVPLWFVLLTGSFDHYWLTLPQNRLVVVFYLGMALSQFRDDH